MHGVPKLVMGLIPIASHVKHEQPKTYFTNFQNVKKHEQLGCGD
jgi:hypothetical protein